MKPTAQASELFKENMQRVYRQGDAFMQWYVLLHAVFALLFAVVYQTWAISIFVSFGAALIFFIPQRLFPGTALTRNMASLSLQIFVMLYIYQMHGLAEMHFFFFTSTTAMIVYQDWKSIWLGVVVIIIQHIVFATLINSGYQGLYYFESDYISTLKLFFHFAIASGNAALASFFAYKLRERTRRDATYTETIFDQARMLEKALSKLEVEDKRKSLELQKARELQQSILPSSTLSHPGFEMIVSMVACTEVGGDYYDYYVHPNGKVTLAIGDATGHGMQAAIIVAAAKSLFQTFVRLEGIVDTFRHISEGIENLHVKGIYLGLTLIEIDNGEVCCISSGMPPVMLFQGSTGRIIQLSEPGPFIGHSTFPLPDSVRSERVSKGDMLLVSTDGLFERFDKSKQFLGYQRIQQMFQQVGGNTLQEVMDSMLAYSNTWQNGHEMADDTTVLLAQFKA